MCEPVATGTECTAHRDDAAFRDPRVIDMSQTLRLVTYNLQRGIRYEQIRHHLDTVPLLRQADIVAVQEALIPAGGRNTLARLADDLEGRYH